MPATPDPHLPQLARLSPEVRDAFTRFLASRDRATLDALVRAALREHLHPGHPLAGDLHDGLRLVDDLGCDSLAIAELVFLLEDAFGIALSNAELTPLRTVGELCAFLSSRLAAR